jgi:DNA-binding XRE family transcriptional regulator
VTPCIVPHSVLTCQDICLIIRSVAYRYLYRLKEHRERRGLTQEELGILSGVSRPTIAALELGYRSAYTTTAAKLAKALRTKPEKLYY